MVIIIHCNITNNLERTIYYWKMYAEIGSYCSDAFLSIIYKTRESPMYQFLNFPDYWA